MIYLRELCDQVVWNLHGVMEVVKNLCKLPFICGQHFRDGNNNVLNLIFLEAKLQFTNLLEIFKKDIMTLLRLHKLFYMFCTFRFSLIGSKLPHSNLGRRATMFRI